MAGVILFKKICTTAPCRLGPVPAGGIAHHRAERGRDVGRAPGLSSHQNALCRVSRVRAAWFGRCAPWSLLGQASAGKEVEAREAVAWQTPVGPSDDGIRGSMDASAPDERKTPVTGVLIFVGRAERPGVRPSDGQAPGPVCHCVRTDVGREGTTCTICHCNRSGRHAAVAPRGRGGQAAQRPRRAPSASLPTMRPSLALFRSGFNPS